MRILAAACGALVAACLLVGIGAAASGSAQAAPSNDNFASATPLSGATPSRTGDTNVGATMEAGEDPAIDGSPGGASVWYVWTAPFTGVVTIDTATSTFDTLLAAYTGSSVSTVTKVPGAENDSWKDDTSRIRFAATSGTQYRIKVDGFFGETGTINLHVKLVTPPANDNFASATVVTGQNVSRNSDTNDGARLEAGEATNVGPDPGGASVWYSWTAPITGPVTVDTSGSGFDTLLGVYTGSTVSTLLLVVANDDTKTTAPTSLVRFAATAGTTYKIRVDGFDEDSGIVHLHLVETAPPAKPANDDFANAIALSTRTASRTGDTSVGATLESLEPATVAGQSAIASVWYRWTAPVSASVTIDTATSTFDTLLGVYTGGQVDDVVQVVSDDDGGANLTSTVTFDADAGTTYRIRVDGYYGATGTINLHLAEQKGEQEITITQPAPAAASVNTSFSVAATAPGGPVTFTSSGVCTNVGATFTVTSSTGTCFVLYDQAGNADYNAAPELIQLVAAQKAAQTISVTTHAPATATFGTSFGVAANAPGGPVTFTSSGSCTNSGSTFTMTSGTGTCQVKYDQAGGANFAPAPQVVETVTAQKANQTISVTAHAPATAGFNTGFTVAATAPGGAVTFSSSGSCSNVGATFTMTSPTGTCSVQYDQAGSGNYNAAPQVVETVTAQKANQTIAVTNHAPAAAAFNASFSVAATAPGGAVTFSSSGSCSNVGATFTMTSATGTCSVQYDQAGSANYNAAPQVVETVTAQKANQAITVTTHAPASAIFNTSFGVAANAPGGVVTFSTSGACSNSGSTVTMTSGTGTCQVMYDQSGSGSYNAAPQVVETVTAQKASQAISVTTHAPLTKAFGNGFTVAANAPAGAVAFSASGVCTNVGATFTMTSGTGTCQVIYDQAGSANYTAALQIVEFVSAQKASQGISVTTHAPATKAFGTSFSVAATAPAGPVTFSSSGSCSNVGTTYTMTSGSGICRVLYDQAGNANYIAANQVEEDVVPLKLSQTITVTAHAPASATNGTGFTVAATGGASGNPVTFSSAGACSNVGATFTMTSGTGTCQVSYDQAGTTNYDAAPQVVESVTAQPAGTPPGTPTAVSAVAGNHQATVSWSTPTSNGGSAITGYDITAYSGGIARSLTSVGVVNQGVVTGLTNGTAYTFKVAAKNAFGSGGQSAESNAVTPQKANQVITVLTHAPASAAYGSFFTVLGTAPGGNVDYSSTGACVKAIGSTFVMTSGTGTCQVMYDQGGNDDFNAAPQVVESVTAQKAAQTISVTTHAPSSAANGTSFTVAATAPGGAVSYSSSGVCTNVGATYTMTSGSGTCQVRYDQAGNGNYTAAPQVLESVTALTSATTPGSPTAVSAVAGSRQATVSWSAPGSTGGSSITGYDITRYVGGVAQGVTPVGVVTQADVTGLTNGTTYTFTVAAKNSVGTGAQSAESNAVTPQKANQTITVTAHAPATAAFNAGFTVAATAPGGAVTFTSSGACSNVGATFTMNSATGTCQVLYDQAGGVDFNAAPQVVETVTAQKASQTISVTTHAPGSAVYLTGFGVAANAPGGVVSVSTTGACSNSGNTVTMTSGTGTCQVLYDQAGNGNYNAAPQVVETVAALKASQSISVTVHAPVTKAFGDGFTVAANASGGAVTFSSSGACSNVGATFTMTSGSGTCQVLFDQAGNANYNAAPQVVETVTAQKANQTINVTAHAPGTKGFNESFTVAATAPGGAVAISNSGSCSNVGATFTMTSATGTCQVLYDQAGNGNYNAAPQVVETVTAQKGSQTITVTTHAPVTKGVGESFSVAATAPGGAVTFASSGSCSNVGATFTMNSAIGACQVLYDQAGNANYNAAPQVVETVTVQKANQTISVTLHAPASAVFNTSFAVAANAPGGVVSVSTSGACSNSGNTVTMTGGTGTCQVLYDQAGNVDYNAAPQVVETVNAQKANQTISVTAHAPAAKGFGDSFTVAATAAGGAVTFSSAGACSNVGGVFTMTSGTGTCSVSYDQPGGTNYNAALQVVETVAAQKANQTISVTAHAPATKGFGDSFTVAATAAGGAVTFSSAGACSNVGAVFTMTSGTGTCSVSYDQPGGTNFSAAPQVVESVAAAKASQAISVTAHAPASAVVGNSFTVAATAPGGAVTFSSSGACSNAGATFTITSGTGTCSVKYDQGGNGNFDVAPQVVETVTALPSATAPSAPTDISAAAGSRQANVSWSAPAANGGSAITGYEITVYVGGVAGSVIPVGVVTQTTVPGLTNGTAYTFKVAAKNAVGTGAQSAESNAVTPQKANQTITVTTAPPVGALVGASFTVAATAPGGAVAFSSSGACTNVGATFTMTSGTGVCQVNFDQAGTDDLNAAPQVATAVTAQKASQAISVTTHAPSTALAGTSFTVAATAPGGSVAFSSAGACTNSGAVFTMTSGAGTCSVLYDQAGSADYNAASQVAESVTATSPAPTRFTLTVAKSGSGTVTGSAGGIDCGSACTADLAAGTSLTLTAAAAAGFTFSGWSGACTGSGTCAVTMDAAKAVTATFVQNPLTPPKKVVYCVVPNLKGKTLAAAKRKLTAAHCKTGRVTKAYSRTVRKSNVISQSPKAGKKLRSGSKVNFVISRGRR